MTYSFASKHVFNEKVLPFSTLSDVPNAPGAGEASAPLLFGPKARVRAALEMSGVPATYVVAYGFASYWANGLGEVGARNRVPPSPVNSSRQVPFYGNGRTKRTPPPSTICLHKISTVRVGALLRRRPHQAYAPSILHNYP